MRGSLARRRNPSPEDIVEILRVRDTREYEEGPDGKFYPIPGSGTRNECSRCGREHEVHATVKLASGRTAVVGTGCMGSKSLNVEARKRASAATTEAKAAARLRSARERLAAWDRAVRDVEQLRAPSARSWTTTQAFKDGGSVEVLKASAGDGEATLWLNFEKDSPKLRRDLEAAAIRDWRRNRLAERGFRPHESRHTFTAELEHAERLARRAGVKINGRRSR